MAGKQAASIEDGIGRELYRVAYKNWQGQWITAGGIYKRRGDAEKVRKHLARTIAENGRAVVFIVHE